jgi:hypothetical protein
MKEPCPLTGKECSNLCCIERTRPRDERLIKSIEKERRKNERDIGNQDK